ncbi:MAG: type I-B CRISPR-associated protein Cas5 [Saprospiraceae bacterium]|nr:MAG: type I-B CRISPR-associated protein Cas5 [Saprospiraceae bacterium]
MNVIRVDISSWTASFRYPNLISGIQPTLEVPPLSTVVGLMNAAAGRYLKDETIQIGYYFEYAAKGVDLETIYQIDSGSKGQPTNNANSNIMRREFLFEAKLSLYLPELTHAVLFGQPFYPLLLGRSGDLATVESIEEVELSEQPNASKIRGQVIPFTGNFLPGTLQALPKYFTEGLPRKNIGTEPYSVVRFNMPDFTTRLTAYRDDSQGKSGVDIYFHQLNLSGLP